MRVALLYSHVVAGIVAFLSANTVSAQHPGHVIAGPGVDPCQMDSRMIDRMLWQNFCYERALHEQHRAEVLQPMPYPLLHHLPGFCHPQHCNACSQSAGCNQCTGSCSCHQHAGCATCNPQSSACGCSQNKPTLMSPDQLMLDLNPPPVVTPVVDKPLRNQSSGSKPPANDLRDFSREVTTQKLKPESPSDQHSSRRTQTERPQEADDAPPVPPATPKNNPPAPVELKSPQLPIEAPTDSTPIPPPNEIPRPIDLDALRRKLEEQESRQQAEEESAATPPAVESRVVTQVKKASHVRTANLQNPLRAGGSTQPLR